MLAAIFAAAVIVGVYTPPPLNTPPPRWRDPPATLVLEGAKDGEPLHVVLTITADGKLLAGPGLSADEATRQTFASMARLWPQQIAQWATANGWTRPAPSSTTLVCTPCGQGCFTTAPMNPPAGFCVAAPLSAIVSSTVWPVPQAVRRAR